VSSYCHSLIIVERVALVLLRISAQTQRKEADTVNIVKVKLLMK